MCATAMVRGTRERHRRKVYDLKLSVIGCGYLGAVHAAAMASLGHEVVGIDVDARKVAELSRGSAPFYEPGLQKMLREGLGSGLLSFSTDMRDARDASVHFVAVGTPQTRGSNAADLRYVDGAVAELLPFLSRGDLVVGKSTVPVGTAARLGEYISQRGAVLAWNPEFLREGWAVKDTLEPDRIVVGVPDGAAGEWAAETLKIVYSSALQSGAPYLVTNHATAELVKVSANAFLATKISFINAMAEVAEATGADVTTLADALGHDERIGRRFLGAGIGFGGGCLPKDIRAFMARAEELGLSESLSFLREVDAINLRRRQRAVDLVVELLGGSAYGKRVTVLGAAFKPHSDDTRDSPALDVAVRLHGVGAIVTVTDPEAVDNARTTHPHLNYVKGRDEALRGADAVVLVTEWDEYRRDMDPAKAGELVAGKIIVDGRNCLEPATWRAAGWTYMGLGRQ